MDIQDAQLGITIRLEGVIDDEADRQSGLDIIQDAEGAIEGEGDGRFYPPQFKGLINDLAGARRPFKRTAGIGGEHFQGQGRQLRTGVLRRDDQLQGPFGEGAIDQSPRGSVGSVSSPRSALPPLSISRATTGSS